MSSPKSYFTEIHLCQLVRGRNLGIGSDVIPCDNVCPCLGAECPLNNPLPRQRLPPACAQLPCDFFQMLHLPECYGRGLRQGQEVPRQFSPLQQGQLSPLGTAT